MTTIGIAALLSTSIVLQAPPASAPAGTQPVQPSPPLLSGPSAADGAAETMTLVHRAFDGSIESIGPEPDVVAIDMLDLTPEQRATFDAIHAARMSAFDGIIRNNYALVLELASLQGASNQAQRLDVLARTAAAFKPYTDRGTMYQEMWPTLTDAQRQTVEKMLAEYREARNAEVHRELGERSTPRSIASRIKLEAFGELIRESIERQIGLERDTFEQFADELALTPEQRNSAQAIFQPLAIKRFQNIAVTPAEQREAFAAFNKLLDAGQRRKLLGILARRYQPARVSAPPAATKPGATSKPLDAMSYKLAPGPFDVDELLLDFADAARSRNVPAKAYLPKELHEPAPVIVLSPGWGGSRDGYGYLARHWASHGYFCIVLEHDGSDLDFAKEAAAGGGDGAILRVASALRTSVNDPANWINRAKDVTFALNELSRRNALESDPFFKRLDLSHIGMSGHSFGAYTTMLIMGARVDVPGEPQQSLRDSRCIAGIAMSSQGPGHVGLTEDSWSNMAAPMLYMCGTKDYEIGTRDASGRRVAFDRTPAASSDEQMLVTIKDAEHMAFSDNMRGFAGETIQRNPAHHEWILMATTAFWDAHLKNDAAAEAWLNSDALTSLSAGACAVERK